jgi:hypothetical protein
MRDYRKGTKKTDTPAAQRIVTEMQQKYEHTRKLLEDAMATCEPGTNAYLRHLEAIADHDRKHREELVSRGIEPASLGTAARQGWHFVCHVSTQGAASVTEVPADRVEAVLAQRAKDDAARLAKNSRREDEEIRRQLNEEFGFNADGSEKDHEE